MAPTRLELGVAVALLVVLVVVVGVQAAAVAKLNDGKSAAFGPPGAAPAGGGVLVNILGGATTPSGGPTTRQVSVIPLYWDAPAGAYIIHFVAGNSEVTAAFDTGGGGE